LKDKIEKIAMQMMIDVKNGNPIVFSYPKISWKEAEFKDNRFG